MIKLNDDLENGEFAIYVGFKQKSVSNENANPPAMLGRIE